jgi:hypothetical protein
MSRDQTKHFSFLFLVDPRYMPAVRVTVQYQINVRYSLDWRGVVTLLDYNVKPGMATHIVRWDLLEAEMLKAAENNSKQYRRPGQGGRGHMEQDPGKILEMEQRQEQRELNARGW